MLQAFSGQEKQEATMMIRLWQPTVQDHKQPPLTVSGKCRIISEKWVLFAEVPLKKPRKEITLAVSLTRKSLYINYQLDALTIIYS